MKYYITTKTFGNTIDITDPCYDRNTWCRKNDVEIKPGKYDCFVTEVPETYTYDGKTETYQTTESIEIEFVENRIAGGWGGWEHFCEIGVDAGLAGFFENKPDYSREEWSEVCDTIRKAEMDGKKAYDIDCGFFSNTAYGDGEYPVYCRKDKDDVIVALKIVFM